MIVLTAGHVDHGKTALIKALTGVDADRLPEEKRRGITVDLGFAYHRLADGRTLGFVDVPGHEKLVRTMLAGATGVDYVLLVVAADDGIMPQTREHLAILDLLGLTHGVVVLTKIDKVAADRVARVAADLHELLRGTSLTDSPIVPVSAHRGDGLAELQRYLAAAAAAPTAQVADRGFRLAIDRAFILSGIGLVVTGTVHAGSVSPGDRLSLRRVGAHGGPDVRVRGLHVANEIAAEAVGGQRCALNITGPRIEKASIARGDWLVASPLPAQTERADVRLRLLPSEAKALRHWTPVHVHLGSADLTGRVALLEGVSVAPGASALAQLVLDQPASALSGDRFVIRDQSARRTIGGGRIIDPQPPKRNARRPERLAFLRAFERSDDAAALAALLTASRQGIDLDHFLAVRNIGPNRRALLLADLNAVPVGTRGGTLLFAPTVWAERRAQVVAMLAEHGHINPDSFGATSTELLRNVALPQRRGLAAALDALVAEKAIVRFGQLLQLPGHVVDLAPDEDERWHAIQRMLAAVGTDPPRVGAIADHLRETEDELKPLLEKLGRMGRLQRVSKLYFLLPEVVARLADAVETCATGHPEALLTVGHFREATGISRHATMPVLEFFDRVGFTSRHPDGRRVRLAAQAVFHEDR